MLFLILGQSLGLSGCKCCLSETLLDLPEPPPGEEALYNWIGSVLDAAAKDPEIKQTLKEEAVATEREVITPLFQWRYNGRSAGNGCTSPVKMPSGDRLPQSHRQRQDEYVRQQARGNQIHLRR